MTVTVTIREQVAGGEAATALSLELMASKLTVAELSRQRVYQEVQDHNRQKREHFKGLVMPRGSERTPKGYRMQAPRDVDWEAQYDLACKGFESNGFFVLVDGTQPPTLDTELELGVDTDVRFVKLTPLVGG